MVESECGVKLFEHEVEKGSVFALGRLAMKDYIRDPNRRFVADTVAAIGLCAQRLPKMANSCSKGLLPLTRHETFTGDSGLVDEEANVLIQYVMFIKAIIMQYPSSHEKVIGAHEC